MADGENKQDGKPDSGDKTDEPVHKKPRNSVPLICRPSIHEKQRKHEAESSERFAVAAVAVARPEDAALETPVDQPAVWSQQENNELVTFETTEHTASREPTPLSIEPKTGVPGLVDGDVLHNGLYSSELNDDDCSSHASSSDWTPQPHLGSYHFIQEHLMRETDPRTILKDLLPETILPPDLDDMTLWQIIINISEPPKRTKLKDINMLEDVVRLLNECKKILVLTGAGVSVSCGIPDFRSRDGIYARLAIDFPDLPDPQAMFDIEYFRRDPRPFFKFAKEIYPGQFRPSLCHRFIALLDKQEKLLRNYTQNIDTLEQVAGVQRVIQCHGSFATASCLVCKHKVDCEAIREDIFQQVVPLCPRCPEIPYAIMKPDIVFFGENLPEMFHRAMKQDKDEVDLLIVIGSSLKVRPVALIPSSVPHGVPQVLINREPLSHLNFDVELLGDCDVIVNELCHRLGGDFKQLFCNSSVPSEITEKPARPASPIPDVPTKKVQERDVAEHKDTISDTSETTVTDPCPSALFINEGELDPLPCASKEAKPHLDQENGDISVKHLKDLHPCPETSDTTEQAVGKNPSPQHEKEIILESQSAEDPKNRHHSIQFRKQCRMSKVSKNPVSEHLGACQYLFQFPNRYIFHGAEVDSDDESSSDSDDSCSIGDGLEDEDHDSGEYCAAGEDDGDDSVRARGCENKCISTLHTDNTKDKLHTTMNL